MVAGIDGAFLVYVWLNFNENDLFTAIAIMEFWKRTQNSLKVRWGMVDFSRQEQPRPEFEGENVRNLVNGRKEQYFPFYKLVYRHLATKSVIFFFLACVLGVIVALFILRAYLASSWSYYGGIIVASVLNAIQIVAFNQLYTRAAKYLTEYENHKTETEYANSLIIKRAVFKFINSYSTLFYMAFFRQFETDADLSCSGNTCLEDLAYQLAIVFSLLIFFDRFAEIAFPYIMKVWRTTKDLGLRINWTNLRFAASVEVPEDRSFEKEASLNEFESMLDEYEELYIQFGYVTLFVIVFPLAPLLAFLNNLVGIRIDSYKFLFLTQRALPKAASDIGMWYKVIETVARISIITNVAVACIYSEQISDWLDSSMWRAVLFVITEHVLFLLQQTLQFFIPDVPDTVKWQIARQDYVVDVLIKKAEDPVSFDEEDDDGGEEFADTGEILLEDNEEFHDTLPASFAPQTSVVVDSTTAA
eukprot:TRINITY_DN2287_c0_g1_i4.p1 TRINITY_DN2287_c0_g1~~TRINITY_DN2287_c0_g1_i4.p1  ORF type:complete len:473 (-),score=136.31 TRINITY_DN2287_c0_g1_i4:602-2020(-)